MPLAQETLEDFALKGRSFGRLTGVSLGVHAIPDAFLVLHTGVGCKYKGAGQICLHDLARPSHHREGYTEVTDAALVKGSASRIGVYVRNWYAKRKPAFMALSASTFLEMTGEDFAGAVREAARTVPCELAYIPTLGFDGDLYDGYAGLTLEVLRRVPFAKTRPKLGTVTLLGYLFDRYEMDHAANLQQLRHLLAAIGLELGPVLLSGRPFGELLKAAASETLVALPYARGILEPARRLAGRPVTATELPVGIRGTLRWLRDVAEAAGIARAAVESAIRSELEFAQPQITLFRQFVQHRLGRARLVIFADTPLAAGLAALGVEMGLPPLLVGLTDESLGGRKAFEAAVARAGVELPGDLEIQERPSLQSLREKVAQAQATAPLAAVFGSSAELNALSEGPAPDGPLIEIGFPSVSYHVLYPTPTYGLGGALALCQRLMNLSRR